jgi:hypothetical protein
MKSPASPPASLPCVENVRFSACLRAKSVTRVTYLQLIRDEPEKIIRPVFAMLRNGARCALVGIRSGLIENHPPRVTRVRGIRDERKQEPQNLTVPSVVDREMAAAYCCGQTGGRRVIAAEITDHFSCHRLWIGGADV